MSDQNPSPEGSPSDPYATPVPPDPRTPYAPQQPHPPQGLPYPQGQPYQQGQYQQGQGYPQGQPYQYQQPGQPYQQGQYPPPGQPYPPQPYPYAYGDPNAKSRVAAGLLGIFLGGLGIHRFYVGHVGIGLTMLLVNLIGGIVTLGIASIGVVIWGLVEGILYLVAKQGYYSVDAQGRPLRS